MIYKTEYFVFVTGLVAIVLATGLVPGKTRVEADWSPARLASELRNSGTSWQVYALPSGSVLMCRHTESLSWDDLYREAEHTPRLFVSKPGRLYIVLPITGTANRLPPPGDMYLGHLIVRGHADELRKVSRTFAE